MYNGPSVAIRLSVGAVVVAFSIYSKMTSYFFILHETDVYHATLYLEAKLHEEIQQI